jgi:hypothetical protein
VKYLRLTLAHSATTIHPMHRFANEHDAVEAYRMLHWNVASDGPNTLLFYVEGEREAYVDALADLDSVVDYTVTPVDDDAFYVYVDDVGDGVGQQLVDAVSQGSLVLASPLEYLDDGRVQFTLVGESADLRAAVDAIPDDIRVELDRAGEYDDGPAVDGLTDRQRAALDAAVDVGYYEVPREGSVEDVAERLDCSPGTASEHLRKAEATLASEAVGESS